MKDGYFIIQGTNEMVILPYGKYYNETSLYDIFYSSKLYQINLYNKNVSEVVIPDGVSSIDIGKNKFLNKIELTKDIKSISLDHSCIITNFDEIKDNCTINYI